MSGPLRHDPLVVIPSPARGPALRHLGILDTDEVPMVAAHWLTEYDSPALRRLAGLNGSDGWLMDQLWPDVLSDLVVHEAGGPPPATRPVETRPRDPRRARRSITEVMSQVIRAYVAKDYPRYLPEAGHLFGLDDELNGGWGRTFREVLAEAEQTLTEWAERRALPS